MKKRTLTPLAGRVVLFYAEAESTTEGGIVKLADMVEAESARSSEAIVIAVGPSERAMNGELIECPVEPGQTVICSRMAGRDEKITLQGREATVTIVPFGAIVAVVTYEEEPDIKPVTIIYCAHGVPPNLCPFHSRGEAPKEGHA